MKLRNMVKTPKSPLMVISHKNTSAIHQQKSAGRQVRAIENSQDSNEKLSFTSGLKENKISTINTHSKRNSTQSGKVSKKRHSAAKRIVEVKRAGRGKKSQCRNAKLATANVLLTDLDSVMSSTLIKNNRCKVVKAVKKMAKQKSVILSEVKPPRKKSLNSLGEVSRSSFSLISEINSHRKGKKKIIAKLPNSHIKKRQSVASFSVQNKNTKKPELYNDVASVNSSSNFAATVSRKQSFQERKIQVTSSNTIKASIASLRFERTERKEQIDSKMSKHTESMSQNVNYIAPKNYVSFSKTLTHTDKSVSNNITADKSLKLKKPDVVKNNITDDKVLRPRMIKARSHARHVLQNKQARNKPEKRKAERKSQVKNVGTTTKFSRKQIQSLSKKQMESASVLRNGRPLRSSSQKSPQSYKKYIPRGSSIAKKSKYRSVNGKKKTAVVKVSEIAVNIHKRPQNMAIKTRQVNKLSSLTLKSLQTGKGKQFASLTQTAKESVGRKKRRLTPKDHLPQKKSLRASKQYAPLLAIEVTPIQSVVEISPRPVTSSPAIVSSVCKASGQTTPSQARKKEELNQRRSLSLPALSSENVSRQSYSSKCTSTPILAYSSYRIKKSSSLPAGRSVTIQRHKKSVMKHAKKNTPKQLVAAKMKKLLSDDKAVTGLSVSNNKERLIHRKNRSIAHAAKMKKLTPDKIVAVISVNSNKEKLKKKLMKTSRAAYSTIPLSMQYALSPEQSAKKKNSSLISSVMNVSKPHHFTVEKHLHKLTPEVKVVKLSLPVSAETLNTRPGKLNKRLQNNSVNMHRGKNLRSSHHLNKDMKLASSHKQKSVSYVVKRTQKQYQSRQKMKPKSKSYLHRTFNRQLPSQMNIPSLAAKVTPSQKSHKDSGNSSQAEKQSELLQRQRNVKIYSSSTENRKNASLSNVSISARSIAEPVPQMTNVTDIAFPSSIKNEVKRISAIGKKTPRLSEVKRVSAIGKKTPRLSGVKRVSAIEKKTPRLSGVKRISAIGKKTPRPSEGGKKKKPVTNARNVRRLSHSNTEDNLELIKDVLLSQAKHSKKFLPRSPKFFPRKEKSLISLRKGGSLCPSKVVKKSALRRIGKRESLPAISVKNEAKNNKDSKIHHTCSAGKKQATKSEVGNIHSNKNTQLGVKAKTRKPPSPVKQNTEIARTAVDAKVNLSYPEKIAFKVVSRQNVSEVSSFELQKLRLIHPKNKASKLEEIKTLSLKKSGKLPTNVDERTSLTKITDSSVKPAEVQGNTMAIPKQTETSKPVRLINEVQQAIFSPSQKKIFTQSKKKVTKAIHSKMFINEKRPKLLSEGGIKKCKQTRKRINLDSVSKAEMIKWLTPGQETRYAASSQNLTVAKISVTKKRKKLPKIQGRKSASLSQKRFSPAKTTESEKIDFVSPRQMKLSKPSTIGYKIKRTKSSKSPRKTGKKTHNKITDNVLLKKVNPQLSKRAKATKLIVPSARITRLCKGELTQSKTLSLKKSGKMPTKVGKRTSLTRITDSSVMPAEVQGNTIAIPKQTETSKPVRLIKEVQKAIPSPSQKKIFTQSKKKVTKAVHSKMFVIEKRSKLLSEGGITKSKQNRKRFNHGSVIKAEMMNWLTPGQNKAYFLANVGLLPRTLSKRVEAAKLNVSSARIARQGKGKNIERIGLVSPGQKKAPEAPSHGRCKIPRTKSSKSAKGKGKKVINKSTISDKIFSGKVSSDKVKRRKSNILLPKIKGIDKAVETDNINLVLPMQNEESELLLSGYKIQRNKSSAQKKTGRKKTPNKILGKIVSKKLRPKLSVTRRFVTSSPNISRSVKAKHISVISSEQTEEPQPLPGRDKTQKTKILSPSKKVGKKKKTINETSELLSSKVSPSISARVKRNKSVPVSPKITRLSKSKDLKKFVSVSLGDIKSIKPSPKGRKTQTTKLFAIPKEMKKKTVKVKLVKQIPSKIHPSEPNSKVNVKIGAHISSPTRKNNKRKTNLRNSLVSQGQKTLGKILSKKQRPKLSVTKTPVTSPPNISRSTKAKQINIISSEQTEESHSLPGRDKTQKTKILSPSKKVGKKKKTINETSELISSKVSPNTSARVKRSKSVSVSPKMTRIGMSKDKKFASTSPGSKKALKPPPRGKKMREITFSAVQKETEKKKTVKAKSVKQILSNIHPSKPNSKLYVKIDASVSSAIKGRGNNLKNTLVPQGQKGKSKQLSGRQNNKKRRFTDVSKSASLGTMSDILIHARLRSPGGTSNVSFKKTDQVYTLNKSPRKSQQSRYISTVWPLNLTCEYASNETISPSQLKRTRETPLMINDMYAKQAQNIRPSTRETAQASPAKLQEIYEGLGRRSLLSSNITDSYYSQQTNRTSVTVPLDTKVARRKDKISLFPEKTRAESYICNVSYTRNDREDRLSVSRTTKSPQISPKNISYSEKSRQVSTSKVSFLSPIDNAGDHTKYIAGTPFPVQEKSAVSRMHVDSARNSDTNMETISSSQPMLSDRQHITADFKISNPVTTHIVCERDSDEESVEDSYTKEGYSVEAEKEEKMYINREDKEHDESQEIINTNDVYVEEIGRNDSQSVRRNPHAKQCIIS